MVRPVREIAPKPAVHQKRNSFDAFAHFTSVRCCTDCKMPRCFVLKMECRYRAPSRPCNSLPIRNLIKKFRTTVTWRAIHAQRSGYGAYCDRVSQKWRQMIHCVGASSKLPGLLFWIPRRLRRYLLQSVSMTACFTRETIRDLCAFLLMPRTSQTIDQKKRKSWHSPCHTCAHHTNSMWFTVSGGGSVQIALPTSAMVWTTYLW